MDPIFALLLAGANSLGAMAPMSPSPRGPEPVTIRFVARVGDQPFVCGRDYPGLGTSRTTISPLDFRFYVSGVELIDASGKAVKVALTQDGTWQHRGVALLDFEDGTSPCGNGNQETRGVVEGTVPAGDYRGVRFTLGIPFELNHRELVKQPSPLNITSLFWVWRAGYKFLRLDLKADGPVESLFLHLGSTGCVARDTLPSSPAMKCGHPNRSTVTLTDFAVGTDAIAIDVGALLSGSDLTTNQPKTAPGCMSAPEDADCAPLFSRLGLPFGEQPATAQQVFRVVKGMP